MLADIGIIVAVYVIFRAVQSLLQTAPGGASANLHPVAQWALALAAITVCIVAAICGYDIIHGSEKIAKSLSALSTLSGMP